MMLKDLMEKITFGVELECTNGRECPECCGSGQHDCPECDGEGYLYCSECDGVGRVECNHCGGDGYLLVDDQEVECEECRGTGQVSCPECEGNGRIVCDRCDGSGLVDCPECDGYGHTYTPGAPRGWYDNEEHCGWEFKSPVFYLSEYGGFLTQAFRLMRELNFDSSDYYDPTGMHVHVGIPDVGIDVDLFRKRLVDVWAAVEENFVDAIACTTDVRLEKFANPWYDCFDLTNPVEKEQVGWSTNRYLTLNINEAYKEHGTVEFRLWNSPEDRQYLRTAVAYSIGVVLYAALRSHDNLPVTDWQVFKFLAKWYSFLNKLSTYELREAA